MKHYTIQEFVSMGNAQLHKHINNITLHLLADGVEESTLEQFFLAAAEITLRIDEGRMNSAYPSAEPQPRKKGGKHACK